MSANCVPSKYTTSNTMELNSKCEMNASPTNSTNQKENLTLYIKGSMKSQKFYRQSTTTDKFFHNVTTNDPLSPQQQHIIHQSTKSKLLSCKLSPLRILSHAIVQTKKETRRAALTFQIPFHGKTMEEEPCNL